MFHRLTTLVADVRSRANASVAIDRALRDPRLLLRYIRRTGSSAWIRAVFDTRREYEQLASEVRESGLIEELQRGLGDAFAGLSGSTVRGAGYVDGAMKIGHVLALYAVVRKRRPAVVLETGVCNGFSTAILLEGLRRNDTGHLYSVDLPEVAGDIDGGRQFWSGKGGAVVPPDRPSGWLVPEQLQDRWTLCLGRSTAVLPGLVNRLGQIDLFIHDSEHSLENQMFEFRLAWQHLCPGGLLAASDINCSPAFLQFCEEIRDAGHVYFVDDGLAFMVKGHEARPHTARTNRGNTFAASFWWQLLFLLWVGVVNALYYRQFSDLVLARFPAVGSWWPW
ncbi:MAG TPA: class I SAM-dependent methyltransferase [Gemmatimonadaceae bacterium]|nr:class I SAM-dependent methyltransferase [Gemmatimonadaceae bacterium]